jgi:alpha-L-fucosidase 2
MKDTSTTPENAISRRHFLLNTSLATAALGFEPLAGMGAQVHEDPSRTDTWGKLCLWYDRPAETWMTEALSIGNGPMGAMLFGGTEIERVQFNEISLWAGARMAVEALDDEGQDMGAYQAFGDILIHLGHDFSKVTDYRQELDIGRAVHQVTYEYNGVRYQRTAFANHPDRVIVNHLTADKAAALTGRVQLADMHQASIVADGNQLSSVGSMGNGFEYEARLLVLNEKGTVAARNDDACAKNPWNIAVPATGLAFDQCDSVTLILGAGTNFLQDHTRQWLGAHPHAAITQQVDSAARQSVTELLARHVKDHQSLFRRFSLDVGTTAPDLLAKTTLARLEEYAKSTTADPNLEALFCQFGRYLLISCSRPGSLPANLQGVWNDSNEPAWAGDYHSNINIEMNYWPAEPANLAECRQPFIDYV